MSKELSPYLIRRNRPPRKPPRVTVLAEDVESTIQDDLHQYWRVVRKHLGLVLAVPAVLVALAILRDAMTIPLYTSSATLLIRDEPPAMLENATVAIVSQSSENYDEGGQDQTQNELLKSRTLAARVIAAEGLANDPDFRGTPKPAKSASGGLGQTLDKWFGRPLETQAAAHPEASSRPPASSDEVLRGLVSQYVSGLSIEPVKDTQMVTISFTTPNPQLSAR